MFPSPSQLLGSVCPPGLMAPFSILKASRIVSSSISDSDHPASLFCLQGEDPCDCTKTTRIIQDCLYLSRFLIAPTKSLIYGNIFTGSEIKMWTSGWGEQRNYSTYHRWFVWFFFHFFHLFKLLFSGNGS